MMTLENGSKPIPSVNASINAGADARSEQALTWKGLSSGACGFFCYPCLMCRISRRLGEHCCVPMCVPGGGVVLRTKLRLMLGIQVNSQKHLVSAAPNDFRTSYSLVHNQIIIFIANLIHQSDWRKNEKQPQWSLNEAVIWLVLSGNCVQWLLCVLLLLLSVRRLSNGTWNGHSWLATDIAITN